MARTQLIYFQLSKTCYVLKSIRPFMSQDALKTVYHSYLHSLISYGIIFWGNSSNSPHIFQLQKKAELLQDKDQGIHAENCVSA
jgi:hypothetical protein